MNKSSKRTSKHVKMLARNAFDEWRNFQGFRILKKIVDLFENVESIKELVDMLALFIRLQEKMDFYTF